MFHALHGFTSRIEVTPIAVDLINWVGSSWKVKPENELARDIAYLLLTTLLSTVFFASDFHDGNKAGYPKWWNALLDAYYTTAISQTTVGYGDFAPLTSWGKVVSGVLLPPLVAAFDRYVAVASGDSAPEGSGAAFCSCWGLTIPFPTCGK